MRKNKPPYPSYADRPMRAKTRPFALHESNPAGTKAVLRYYKAKHGVNAPTVEEAWKWWLV